MSEPAPSDEEIARLASQGTESARYLQEILNAHKVAPHGPLQANDGVQDLRRSVNEVKARMQQFMNRMTDDRSLCMSLFSGFIRIRYLIALQPNFSLPTTPSCASASSTTCSASAIRSRRARRHPPCRRLLLLPPPSSHRNRRRRTFRPAPPSLIFTSLSFASSVYVGFAKRENTLYISEESDVLNTDRDDVDAGVHGEGGRGGCGERGERDDCGGKKKRERKKWANPPMKTRLVALPLPHRVQITKDTYRLAHWRWRSS